MDGTPVIVRPPSRSGGRRVSADGEILGLAHNPAGLIEFLRRAGVRDAEAILDDSALIEWRGGGPDVWTRGDAPPAG